MRQASTYLIGNSRRQRFAEFQGDPRNHTRVTKLLEGTAKFGPVNHALDLNAGEDKPGIIYVLNCWHAGAGHTIEFFQRRQTIRLRVRKSR